MKRVVGFGALLIAVVLSSGVSTFAAATPLNLPFMVRGAVPGSPLTVIFQVDYPETHPLVPGEFDAQHYHKYDEVVELMSGWLTDYPGLVDVYSAGKSFEGRDIWQMTITNKSTGPAEHKPAMFVGGNRHSGEVTARVAALHFAWTLLSQYGKDPEITKLVDTRAFYVRPMENPDGAELYLCTVQTLRSTTRPYDQDGDGLVDEDIAEDLDGDGFVRQMRQFVGVGKGTHIVDPDDPSGRLMRSVGAGKGDYLVMSEGVDNDGDGRINEDGIGGLDLHRNYPENWRPMTETTGLGWIQSGAGEYPLSEPEMRSLVLFLLTHPNCSIVQTMDTAVPMHLRPPSTSKSEESMFPEDLAYYSYFDAEGRKLTTYPYAGDVYFDYATRGGRTEGNPLFGHSPDWGYFQYGAIWYGDELWGNQEYVKDYNNDGKKDDLDRLWMNDNIEEIKGKIFQNWTPVEHPTLGAVEVGGFNPKFWSQNPPAGPMLQDTVEKQTRFNVLLAKSLPLVTIQDVSVTKNDDGTSTIKVTITNEGFLPDALKQAWLVKIVKKGFAKLELEEGIALAKGSAGLTHDIGFLGGALDAEPKSKEVSWTVTGTGDAIITVRSLRGGESMAYVKI
ncbi:MAG: M14 family metallopeptidase [Firmicutes bacterium]|jgi:hypothetical protein|nr:M14 family metallopeptidase [Bacillota bacterium]